MLSIIKQSGKYPNLIVQSGRWAQKVWVTSPKAAWTADHIRSALGLASHQMWCLSVLIFSRSTETYSSPHRISSLCPWCFFSPISLSNHTSSPSGQEPGSLFPQHTVSDRQAIIQRKTMSQALAYDSFADLIKETPPVFIFPSTIINNAAKELCSCGWGKHTTIWGACLHCLNDTVNLPVLEFSIQTWSKSHSQKAKKAGHTATTALPLRPW